MLKQGRDIAVVVSKSWSEQAKIRQFLGSPMMATRIGDDESHLIIAPLVSDADRRGLWIEVKPSEERVYNMLVPWQYIFSVVSVPNVGKEIGFTLPDEDEQDVTQIAVKNRMFPRCNHETEKSAIY